MSDAPPSATTVVVILGMHRSGTSCLTRALNRCGMHLGDDLLTAPSLSNAQGKWEAREVVEINDRLLAAAGGAWDKVPHRLVPNEELLGRMRDFVARLSTSPVVGWKDPRTVLTYPLWKPLLGDHRVVACWRHPESVAESLALREGWPLEKGLDLWRTYNERLLADVEQEAEVIWFDFEMPPQLFTDWLEQACPRLRLQFDPHAASSFNSFHRHHQHTRPPEDPRLRAVYDRLGRETQKFTATLPSGSSSSSADPPGAPQGGLSRVWTLLSEQVRDLAEVHRQQNALVQRLERHLNKTSRQVLQARECTSEAPSQAFAALEQKVHALDQGNDRLERRLSAQEQFTDALLARWTQYHEQWLSSELRLQDCLADLENEAETEQARRAELDARLAQLEIWEQRMRQSTGYRLAQKVERWLNWPRRAICRLRPGIPAPHVGHRSKTGVSPTTNA
ncbi:MAG: hypothetical protein WD847_14820 [Pirellulales bacterium]